MALVPIAKQGNFLHIYDFKVDPGHVEDFIRLFNQFDYSDDNPMHKSPAQVKDGALVQDVKDPTRFWLIGEWTDIEVHAGILKNFKGMKPEFLKHIVGGKFTPDYGKVVSATPQHILDKAQQQRA
jgi:quinol monooxygenase YgiN